MILPDRPWESTDYIDMDPEVGDGLIPINVKMTIKDVDRDLDLFELDEQATVLAREYIRSNRKAWLREDIEKVANMYSSGEIDKLDLIRKYGVVFDYEKNEILPISTGQYREMLEERMVPHWS